MGAPIIQPKRIHVYGSVSPALVDDKMFEIASSMAWHLHSNGYPVSCCADRKSTVFLAALCAGVKSSRVDVVHFINDNKLDCRERNLVTLTRSECQATQRLHKNNTSGFKGVSWNKRSRKWIAGISPGGKRITLGLFVNKDDAARAYDLAALKYFGPYARLNFPSRHSMKNAITAATSPSPAASVCSPVACP